jgi:uncharacterized protein (TIGR00730 family)
MKNKSRKYPHPKTKNHKSIDRPKDIWNIFKMISEIVEGYESLRHTNPAISIFGSSRTAKNSKTYKLAKEIANSLSDEGYNIITGGGPGIMEAANIGASSGPSLSIGLNIDIPSELEHNEHQDIALHYRYFFTRKVMFIKHSIAYIVMPGGFGTLDELFDIATLMHTKKKEKMPIILVDSTFWKGLLTWMESTLTIYKTINFNDSNYFKLADSVDEVKTIINEFYNINSVNKGDFDF